MIPLIFILAFLIVSCEASDIVEEQEMMQERPSEITVIEELEFDNNLNKNVVREFCKEYDIPFIYDEPDGRVVTQDDDPEYMLDMIELHEAVIDYAQSHENDHVQYYIYRILGDLYSYYTPFDRNAPDKSIAYYDNAKNIIRDDDTFQLEYGLLSSKKGITLNWVGEDDKAIDVFLNIFDSYTDKKVGPYPNFVPVVALNDLYFSANLHKNVPEELVTYEVEEVDVKRIIEKINKIAETRHNEVGLTAHILLYRYHGERGEHEIARLHYEEAEKMIGQYGNPLVERYLSSAEARVDFIEQREG